MWYTVLIMLAIDLGGLLLIYVILRDRVRRATSTSTQMTELRDEVGRLVVELNQTADRNIALVEDRIAALNDLLSTADKKIGLLRREIEKHDVGTQVYSRLAEARPAPPAAGRAPQARSDAAGRAGREGAAAVAQSLSVELSEKPDIHQRVMMLHRAGFSPSLIASRVGVPRGEVELVISLEQRKGQA